MSCLVHCVVSRDSWTGIFTVWCYWCTVAVLVCVACDQYRVYTATDAGLCLLLVVAGLRCYVCENARDNDECNEDGPTACEQTMDTCQTIVAYSGINSVYV